MQNVLLAYVPTSACSAEQRHSLSSGTRFIRSNFQLNPSPSSAASKMNAEGSSQIYSLASTTELSCAQVCTSSQDLSSSCLVEFRTIKCGVCLKYYTHLCHHLLRSSEQFFLFKEIRQPADVHFCFIIRFCMSSHKHGSCVAHRTIRCFVGVIARRNTSLSAEWAFASFMRCASFCSFSFTSASFVSLASVPWSHSLILCIVGDHVDPPFFVLLICWDWGIRESMRG